MSHSRIATVFWGVRVGGTWSWAFLRVSCMQLEATASTRASTTMASFGGKRTSSCTDWLAVRGWSELLRSQHGGVSVCAVRPWLILTTRGSVFWPAGKSQSHSATPGCIIHSRVVTSALSSWLVEESHPSCAFTSKGKCFDSWATMSSKVWQSGPAGADGWRFLVTHLTGGKRLYYRASRKHALWWHLKWTRKTIYIILKKIMKYGWVLFLHTLQFLQVWWTGLKSLTGSIWPLGHSFPCVAHSLALDGEFRGCDLIGVNYHQWGMHHKTEPKILTSNFESRTVQFISLQDRWSNLRYYTDNLPCLFWYAQDMKRCFYACSGQRTISFCIFKSC